MIHDFLGAGAPGLPVGACIVIGAGAAGLAIALSLADAGQTVVLVESGGDPEDRASELEAAKLNAAEQTGLPLDGVVNGRSRMLGGTTALWHGQCMKMHPIDLEPRAWVAHSGWPFGLSELEPHYAAAERFLGVSGLGYGPARWQEHRDLPTIDWDENHLLHDFTEYVPHPHLGRQKRKLVQAHGTLHLLLHATASRVLVEDDVCVGVELVAAGRQPMTLSAERVILAGGGIENARLLMLSDPAGVGLGAGRESTGRYYQDHPIIRTAQIVPRNFRVLQDRYIALHRRGRRLFPKVRLAPAAQRAHGLLDATAVFVHEHDDPARDALRRLIAAARYGHRPSDATGDAIRSLSAPLALARDAYRRYAKGLATGAVPSAVWLQLWVEQKPDPQSRITLAQTHDPLGMRRASLHWRCSDLELHTSRLLTRWIADDLERLGLAEVHELPAMHDDAAWRVSVGDAAHPAGTTRMAADPAHGVVDADLRVHGLTGLYVVGSSCFPTCGYANPTLTIVAMALRLAVQLKQDV